MSCIIGAEAARWAGLQIDLHSKFRSGALTVDQLEWWLNQSKSRRDILMSNPSLHDRILAGKYDWWNENILKWRREDAPPTEVSDKSELLNFNRNISTKSALVEIDKLGFRPANIEELCDYGAKHPEEQRKYLIVALGSVFVRPGHSGRYSPYLGESGARRRLDLDWYDDDWNSSCRFLVVRK